MSFETTFRGNLWTYSPRGGRRDPVAKGVWVIDHRPTGRFMIGSSNNVSKDVDKMLDQLEKGKFPNKLMQQLFDKPDNRKSDEHPRPPMTIIEYPLVNDKEIQMTLAEIRNSNTTPYCLLN